MRLCENWLKTYIDYTITQESPEEFHLWTGMSLIAASVGRDIRLMPKGSFLENTFPNLYIILIGASGEVRKSTTYNMSRPLFKAAFPDYEVFTEVASIQKLVLDMYEHQVATSKAYAYILADELHVLLSRVKQDPLLVSTLTRLYDCPEDEGGSRTISRGVQTLSNVEMNFFATTTPRWLRLALPSDVIGGGFTSRVIFVYADFCDKKNLWAMKPKGHEKMFENLVLDLRKISTLKGYMVYNQEAREWFEKWYSGYDEHSLAPEALTGYFARKHIHIAKVATVLSLSRNDSMEITLRDLQMSKDILEGQEQHLGKVINMLQATAVGDINSKVLSIIARNGKIAHSDLLRKLTHYIGAAELTTIIETLIAAQVVKVDTKGKKTIYIYNKE